MDKRTAPTACKNLAGSSRRVLAALPSGPLVATAVAVALSWPSSGANAAALGAATVQSALGEPLRAEIQIPQLSSEEASTFSARVASPSAFAGAGISYNTDLSNARVSLERHANGQAYLRITTERPISEPVLGIVIEADWASGQITRDYTVLLDPPKRMDAGTTVQETAAAAPTPAPAAATAPQPPRVGRAEQLRPAKTAATAPERSTPAEAGRAPAQRTRSGAVTIQRGDTASQIAVAHGLQGVSLDQMLLAMLRANPNAFIRGNVNLIRAGAVLQMPSAEDARTVTRADARRMVVAQTDDFRAYRSGLARNVQATQATPGSQSAEGPVEPQVAEAQEAPPEEDRLEISKGGTGTEAAAQAAQSRQISDQAERVAELDRNISELSELEKQLAGEANQAGGASNADTGTAPAVADAPSGPDATTTGANADDAASSAEDSGSTEGKDAEAAAAQGPAEPAPATDDANAQTAADVAADATVTADGAAEGDAVAPQPAPLTTAAAAPADSPDAASQGSNLAIAASLPAEQPASVLDQVAEYRWPIVAILVALLALFGIGRSRRRKTEEPLLDEGSGTGGPFVNVNAAVPVADTAAADLDHEEETRLLMPGTADEEEEEDPEVLAQRLSGAFADTAFPLTTTETESGAVSDLVAEADIYVEYGHDERAEELLEQALQAEPGRAEIYRKLAAIYLRRSDRGALAALSARAAAAPDHAEAAWQAVAAVGRELEPNNPRYQEAGATAAEIPAEALDELQPTRAALDQPFNHQVFWAETEKGSAELASDETEGEDHRYSPTTLDFDVDFEETAPLARKSTAPTAAQLTADDLRKAGADGTPQSVERPPGTHEESLDLDIDFSASGRDGGEADDLKPAADVASFGPAPAADSTLMEFDLDTPATQDMQRAADSTLMDFDPDTPFTQGMQRAADSTLMDFGLDADSTNEPAPAAESTFLDFDLDDPGVGTEESSTAAANGNDDPLATKLALAEEFAAIGDGEGARSMARDVAQSATGALKERADAFLRQLGGKP